MAKCPLNTSDSSIQFQVLKWKWQRFFWVNDNLCLKCNCYARKVLSFIGIYQNPSHCLSDSYLLPCLFVKTLLIVFQAHIWCLVSEPYVPVLSSVIFFCNSFAFLIYIHWDAKHLGCRHRRRLDLRKKSISALKALTQEMCESWPYLTLSYLTRLLS